MQNAPIASSTVLDKELSRPYDEYKDFKQQQYYNHLRNKQFGRQLDLLFGTPLYAALGLPALMDGLGAGGAWLMAYPEITGPLLEGMIWGTAADYGINAGSRGYYNGWGDFMHQQTRIGSEELWNWTNPGYLINPLTKSLIGAGESALKSFTDNAVRRMTYDPSPSLFTQYSRNMFGIDPSVTQYTIGNQIMRHTHPYLLPKAIDGAASQAEPVIDYTYKSPLNDAFTRFLYQNALTGVEMGKYRIPIGYKVKGLPSRTRESLISTTINRNVEHLKEFGVSEKEINDYIAKANKLMDEVRVGYFTKEDFKKAGIDDSTQGMHTKENHFIAVLDDLDAVFKPKK
ncbi:MAG: hypothetical protein IJU02_07320 [Lachnospiraceae bacterium]|nr:hypothetical protein [Lachnospiraceae bacterium]